MEWFPCLFDKPGIFLKNEIQENPSEILAAIKFQNVKYSQFCLVRCVFLCVLCPLSPSIDFCSCASIGLCYTLALAYGRHYVFFRSLLEVASDMPLM